MCVHVFALPDECFLLIYDRVPLSDLLRLDKVCLRWAILLKSATARRHTLVLIPGGYGLDQFDFTIPFNNHLEIPSGGGAGEPFYDLPRVERQSVLLLPYLQPHSANSLFDEPLIDGYETEGYFDVLFRPDGPLLTEMAHLRDARLNGQLSTYLAELFPNVDTLVVIHPTCFENELHSVIDLVRSWSLKILKLWLYTWDIDHQYVDRPEQHPIRTLLERINNQQPSLRQLTLDLSARRLDQLLQFTFPVESFAFISRLQRYDSDNSLWNNVHQFDSPELRQLCLGTSYTLEAALDPDFVFTNKVHHLYNHGEIESGAQLRDLCLRLNSLTMLDFGWSAWPDINITSTELVTSLATLRHLTHLRMYINFGQHPVNAFATVAALEGEEPRRIALPHLKILHFVVQKRNHRDFESLSPQVFPSVELVILETKRFAASVKECIICRPNINAPHSTELACRCHRLLVRSLRDKVMVNPLVKMFADGGMVNRDDNDLLDSQFKFFKMVLVVVFFILLFLLLAILYFY